jgi:hypothetical protein
MKFYTNCCLEKEDVVRSNLYQHGYRYDLKKQAFDYFDEHVQQTRQSKYEMPRFKIANNQTYFNLVFSLLEISGEVASQTWTLIRAMATSPKLYRRVLELNKSVDFDWKEIFDSSSIYRMLYALQIVESLLE